MVPKLGGGQGSPLDPPDHGGEAWSGMKVQLIRFTGLFKADSSTFILLSILL